MVGLDFVMDPDQPHDLFFFFFFFFPFLNGPSVVVHSGTGSNVGLVDEVRTLRYLR